MGGFSWTVSEPRKTEAEALEAERSPLWMVAAALGAIVSGDIAIVVAALRALG